MPNTHKVTTGFLWLLWLLWYLECRDPPKWFVSTGSFKTCDSQK